MANLLELGLIGFTLLNSNKTGSKNSEQNPMGSLFGGGNPLMMMGMMSLFGGGLLGGDCGGIGSLLGGGGRSGGRNSGEDFGFGGNSNGRDYGNRNSGGSSFLGTLAKSFGISMLVGTLFSGPLFRAKKENVSNINQQAPVDKLDANNKYTKLSAWLDNSIKNNNSSNLAIVEPKYREIMDAYNAGGKKDTSKLEEAKSIYSTGVLALAKDTIKVYDKDNDGILSPQEFRQKSADEDRHAAELLGVAFDEKESTKASELAFKRLSHSGKSIDDKDLAAVYAYADANTSGHEGITKGNFSSEMYNAVFSMLGKEDTYKNKAGEVKGNYVGEKINGAYDFFFSNQAK